MPEKPNSLQSLIAAILEAESRGDVVDRQALLSQHPEHAESLREFFTKHDSMKAGSHSADATLPPAASSPVENATLSPSAADAEEATLPLDDHATLAPSPLSSNIGDKVDYFGDYELLEEIARGGMGVVYKARQVNLNRIVAIKMILAGQLAGEEDVNRFYTEAEAAANLDHPGIVPIFEVGQHQGQHYFSMGYIEGQSLAQKVANGPLPPREAAELVKKICVAMAYAHERGVIHRDLKPANILLDQIGQPKVTDFGLAKQMNVDSGLTGTGQILGTPSYMAPEQASGKVNEVGPLADVYALGAVLYCLLTGRPPFQAAIMMDTLLQVLNKEPVSIRLLNPVVPRDLETICLKCLEKQKEKRYKCAGDLSDELQRFLDSKPVLARPVSPVERSWRWCKRNPVIASSCALLLLVGITARYFVATAQRQTQVNIAANTLGALQSSTGPEIQSALRKLDALPRTLVDDGLRARFNESQGQQKLSLAYALARLGQVELDVIVSGIVDVATQSPEVSNIVAALVAEKDSAITKIKSLANKASSVQDWKAKARLAVVAMYLGDSSIAAEMLQAEPGFVNPPSSEPTNPLDQLRRDTAEAEGKWPRPSPATFACVATYPKAYYYLDRTQEALSILNDWFSTNEFPDDEFLLMHAFCSARLGDEEAAKKSINRLSNSLPDKDQFLLSFGQIMSQAWLGTLEEPHSQLDELIATHWRNGLASDAASQYKTACLAAQLVRAQKDPNSAESKLLAMRAVDLLRRSYTALGYCHHDIISYFPGMTNFQKISIRNDVELAPLFEFQEFKDLLREIAPETYTRPWDPIQRTEFIAEFPDWHGDLERLAELLKGTNDVSLRSGISLSVGSVANPGQQAKEGWQKAFAQWYVGASDSGTHSAVAWAAGQWGIALPMIGPTSRPNDESNWWHTPMNLTMIKIPTGSVTTDDWHHDLHPITVSQPFWLSDRETSIDLFRQFMSDQEATHLPAKDYGRSSMSDEEAAARERRKWVTDKTISFAGDGAQTHAVDDVSWGEAVMFCNWLSRRHGLPECYEMSAVIKTDSNQEGWIINLVRSDGFRLPTEDEWEFACRALTTTAFASGEDEGRFQAYAAFLMSKAALRGSKLCNGWGLFDMHGNVAEWCWDINTWGHRLSCGGSWGKLPTECQSSSREEPYGGHGGGAGVRLALGMSSLSGSGAAGGRLEEQKALFRVEHKAVSDREKKVSIDPVWGLDSLFLNRNQGDAVLQELAGRLTSLQSLSLGPQVTDVGLKELAGLTSLQSLRLYDSQITDAGLKELAGLTGLQSLKLHDSQITDAGLKELARLTSLQSLELHGSQVTDAGLKELAGLTSLKWLWLNGSQITDAGLKELAGLASLQELELYDSQVTDAGLKELAGLKSLQLLSLYRSQVTEAGVEQLRKSLSGCRVLKD